MIRNSNFQFSLFRFPINITICDAFRYFAVKHECWISPPSRSLCLSVSLSLALSRSLLILMALRFGSAARSRLCFPLFFSSRHLAPSFLPPHHPLSSHFATACSLSHWSLLRAGSAASIPATFNFCRYSWGFYAFLLDSAFLLKTNPSLTESSVPNMNTESIQQAENRESTAQTRRVASVEGHPSVPTVLQYSYGALVCECV